MIYPKRNQSQKETTKDTIKLTQKEIDYKKESLIQKLGKLLKAKYSKEVKQVNKSLSNMKFIDTLLKEQLIDDKLNDFKYTDFISKIENSIKSKIYSTQESEVILSK